MESGLIHTRPAGSAGWRPKLSTVIAVVALLFGGVMTASCTSGTESGGEPRPARSLPVTLSPETPEATESVSAEVPPVASPRAVSPTPNVETRKVTETRAVPYARRTVKDSSLLVGMRQMRVKGVPGVKTLTYEVRLIDGTQVSKRLVSEKITKRPVTEVVAVGTRPKAPPKPTCDPNYSGCVPIASDVDCEGGSGDGPAYVKGPVTVIGVDIYDLDRDGDGVGCDE